MSERSAPAGLHADEWKNLLPLLREINDLKRIRSPELQPSIAAAWFRQVAFRLFHSSDESLASSRKRIANRMTASIVAATRLGAVSGSDLQAGGLSATVIRDIRVASVLERRSALGGHLTDCLVEAIADPGQAGSVASGVVDDPAADERRREGTTKPQASSDHYVQAGPRDWIERLIAQPRAGATAPAQPRIVLEPVESCAEHCLITAAYAVLLAPSFGADPGDAFTIGLAHHVHNARLPDAGFAGEALIGEHLDGLIETLRKATLATMSVDAAAHLSPLLREIASADTPLARTFHTADTIDRVLQIDYFARCNRFTLADALGDMELVHAGPVQAFQQAQLDAAGLGAR